LKKHTKIYYKKLNYFYEDFVPSEISQVKAVDIHHIVNRENRIENLMAVTRIEHLKYGDKKKYMVFLLNIHYNFLLLNNIDFDKKWFNQNINKYKIYAQ